MPRLSTLSSEREVRPWRSGCCVRLVLVLVPVGGYNSSMNSVVDGIRPTETPPFTIPLVAATDPGWYNPRTAKASYVVLVEAKEVQE